MRITFYEKPGCTGNARQQAALRTAGHVVVVRSLLEEPWSAARLRAFFGKLPVEAWFNLAAPAAKSGVVRPQELSPEAALALLLAQPLLIRRPLLEAEGRRCVGFDAVALKTELGLDLANVPEGCAHPPTPCPTPG